MSSQLSISISQKLAQRYYMSFSFSGKRFFNCLNKYSRHYGVACKTSRTQGSEFSSGISGICRPSLFNLSVRWCGHECITHQNCWKCGTAIEPDMEQYFCICGVVQPPLCNRSYFQVFGIEETFDINPKQLKTKYQKLQTLLHPDRYGQKCDIEKGFSEQHSSLVNKAYHTLQSPLKRGLHILGIKDGDLEKEGERDKELLSELFDMTDRIEEAKDKDELIEIKLDNQNNMEELIKVISNSFKAGDTANAKQNLMKLKYYEQFQNHIEQLIS